MLESNPPKPTMLVGRLAVFGREDDTVGNPHRAQIYRFELFELILLLKLDKHFPVERFEATVSQSTVSPTPLIYLQLLHMFDM